MSRKIILQGMTWDHSRGYLPMVATAQRFHELHPEVEIVWAKRSLQAFADKPLDPLAARYDFLVIDHPWAGHAERSGILLPLEGLLPKEFLADQACNSVGQSHASYEYDGSHWALAIDAAAPVSAYRPDLLEKAGAHLPRTWEELIALGRKGLVCCPSIPLDTYCNFLNLGASAGATLFPNEEEIIAHDAGLTVLARLKELAGVVPREFFKLNPIMTCEAMTKSDEYAYCPFTYGYSNYARPGYAPNALKFGGIVTVEAGQKPSTMLGGTGLAISSKCKHRDIAVEYAKFVASPETQRGLYFESGGQPGHRAAWLDDRVNEDSSNYFFDTLPTLDAAFVRPRYAGYLKLQDHAGEIIHKFLRRGGEAAQVLDAINQLYRDSLPHK